MSQGICNDNFGVLKSNDWPRPITVITGKTFFCFAKTPNFLCSLCQTERAPPRPRGQVERPLTPARRGTALYGLTGARFPGWWLSSGGPPAAWGLLPSRSLPVTRAERPKGSENSSEQVKGSARRKAFVYRRKDPAPCGEVLKSRGALHLHPKPLGSPLSHTATGRKPLGIPSQKMKVGPQGTSHSQREKTALDHLSKTPLWWSRHDFLK